MATPINALPPPAKPRAPSPTEDVQQGSLVLTDQLHLKRVPIELHADRAAALEPVAETKFGGGDMIKMR